MTLHNKGITGREAGHRLTDIDSNTRDEKKTLVVTMDNVHRLTTYELRQELKRRGYFLETISVTADTDTKASATTATTTTDTTIDERKTPQVINYRVLLETTVRLLQREEAERQKQRMEEIISSREGNSGGCEGDGDNGLGLKERLKREREERKAAAVERSRVRQAEKDYFARKKGLVAKKEEGVEVGALSCESDGIREGSNGIKRRERHELKDDYNNDDDTENDKVDVDNNDPFAPQFRSKIGGRYV